MPPCFRNDSVAAPYPVDHIRNCVLSSFGIYLENRESGEAYDFKFSAEYRYSQHGNHAATMHGATGSRKIQFYWQVSRVKPKVDLDQKTTATRSIGFL